MLPEVLWVDQHKGNLFKDLVSFAQSLDHYEIVFQMDNQPAQAITFLNGTYSCSTSSKEGSFECPQCGHPYFDVLIGELDDKTALGLACHACETYGVVFPNGM